MKHQNVRWPYQVRPPACQLEYTQLIDGWADPPDWCFMLTTVKAIHVVIDNVDRVVRWKVHESTLLGIGSLSKLILDHVSTHKLPLDINTFLQNVVLVDLNQNGEFFDVVTAQNRHEILNISMHCTCFEQMQTNIGICCRFFTANFIIFTLHAWLLNLYQILSCLFIVFLSHKC